jgi:hypothetical protein
MEERTRYHSFTQDSARWDALDFREGDIVISTPAKCGTTWTQMMCALLIFRTPDLPAPLASLSPWLDMQTRPIDEVVRDLDAQTHRRFIKTHTPLDGIPFDARVTYLHVARDPRDVALSWDNHMANVDMAQIFGFRVGASGMDDFEEIGLTGPPPPPPEDPVERFWLWIEGGGIAALESGLPAMVHHVDTFWQVRDEPNVHLFHYADLRADLTGQMTRLADVLGLEPPTDELVAAATFEHMKSRADELIPNSDTPFWRDNGKFFDRARAGDWRDIVTGEGQQRYDKALAALAGDELASWLHRGWLGATESV